MKITGLQTFRVGAGARNWLFVKLRTDAGVHGWGEATLEWREESVEAALRSMTAQLVGRDPLQIERLTQQLDVGVYWRGGAVLHSALSGVNQALWDVFGKVQGVPVYQLLGGAVRDRIRVYQGTIYFRTLEESVQQARNGVAAGFTALKGPPLVHNRKGPIDLRAVDEHAEIVGAVRRAIGDEVDLLLDCQGALNPPTALAFARAVEAHRPLFLEEPVPSDNPEVMATLARSTSIPIAAGERLFGPHEFRPFLERQALSVLQPDLCHAGGISGVRKIAIMAEPYWALLAPHNAGGPIGTAAALHVDAVSPNFLIQELPSYAMPLWDRLLGRPFLEVRDGHVALPTGPGLGVDLDAARLADMPPQPTPLRPYTFADGAYGGWL